MIYWTTGVKLSVLCPSRGRPEMLMSSRDTFKDEIEFLVAVDKDDPALPAYKALGIPLTITKRYGYPHLEKYYNILAKKATGDWLFNWNDDAFLGMGNVVGLLEELDPQEPAIGYFDNGDTRFPLISRGLYELLGHFAGGPAVDSYLHALAVHGGIIKYLPTIDISHLRDMMTDPTSQQKELGIVDERMQSDAVINQRFKDIDKILEWKHAQA